MDSFEEIKIKAPIPGTCRLCATVHKPDMPHDRDSLYYQNWFFKRYRRFPTWTDAMAHCTDAVKRAYTDTLAKRGVYLKGGDEA